MEKKYPEYLLALLKFGECYLKHIFNANKIVLKIGWPCSSTYSQLLYYYFLVKNQ